MLPLVAAKVVGDRAQGLEINIAFVSCRKLSGTGVRGRL